MLPEKQELADADYVALADFRHAIRAFQAFSEVRAAEVGLTAQQHQALLAIRAATAGEATVGHIAERLVLKPHSVTGLIDRLESLDLVKRKSTSDDRRRAILTLTDKARNTLAALSAVHRDEIRRLHPRLAEVLTRIV